MSGVVVALLALFPPVGIWARCWVVGDAAQFTLLAYAGGFSGHPMFSAYPHPPGSGLSALGDQELAVAVLWAVPGLVLVPVVLFNLVSWLKAQEGSSPEGPGAGDRAAP